MISFSKDKFLDIKLFLEIKKFFMFMNGFTKTSLINQSGLYIVCEMLRIEFEKKNEKKLKSQKRTMTKKTIPRYLCFGLLFRR